jgi:hypothetical protein
MDAQSGFAPDIDATFDPELVKVWKAVAAAYPLVIEHVTGPTRHAGIELLQVVRAFHEQTVATGATVYPALVTTIFERFPKGAFHDRAFADRSGTDQLADDVTAIWMQCIEALRKQKAEAAEQASRRAATWDPWEDPPPPAWPPGILAAQIEDTLALIALRDGIDIGTLAVTHIAAGSAAAPKDTRFFAYNARGTGWCVPPIFWSMIIGDSGFRKTILGQFFAALRDAQANVWRPFTIALRNWYATPTKNRGPKPIEPHSFIVDDFTVEALQRILAATTRGSAVVTDELAGLFEFDRYRQSGGSAGSAARGFLLAAYEDEPRAVHRVNRDGANIEHTGLSVFGGIQAARLADFTDLAKDGLLQRFAPIRTPPAVAARPEINVGHGIDHIRDVVARLCYVGGQNYTTTPDGTALIQDTEQTAFGYATITDYAAGWPGFCHKLHGTHARLALILHMLEAPDAPVIPTDTVERAHRLVHSYVLQHAADFYASIPGSHRDRLRDIAGWLLTKKPGADPHAGERIIASDLTHNVKTCRPLGSKGIAEVLDPFVTRGWLTPETDFPGNRAWFFDPAIRSLLADRQIAERERRAAIRDEIDRLAAKRRT